MARKKKATKKTAPAAPKAKVNKTQFVLGMPGASGAEVVAAAKKEGIGLSVKYVYTIRSAAKAKARGAKRSAKREAIRKSLSGHGLVSARQVAAIAADAEKLSAVTTAAFATAKAEHERSFVGYAVLMGLDRAHELLGTLSKRAFEPSRAQA